MVPRNIHMPQHITSVARERQETARRHLLRAKQEKEITYRHTGREETNPPLQMQAGAAVRMTVY